jgi:hypothetical protein
MFDPDHLFSGDLDRLGSLVASIHESSARKRLLEGQLEGLIERLRLRHPTQTATCGELAELGFLFLQVSRSSDLSEDLMSPVPERRGYGHSRLSALPALASGFPERRSYPSLNLRSDSESNDCVAVAPTLKVTEIGEIPNPVTSGDMSGLYIGPFWLGNRKEDESQGRVS